MPAEAGTVLLSREDAYLRECDAMVVAVTESGGVVLDRTVFYAQGGGQPGDSGEIVRDGIVMPVTNATYATDRVSVAHLLSPGSTSPAVGERVQAKLDWSRRYARMKIHTALHLLSVVLPYPVSGGSIGDGEGRLDFDIPEAGLDKSEIAAKLNALVARDAVVSDRWITDAELDANPGLVKTMSVQPPRGSGRVRLVEIAGIDLQPCGGTHVRRTGEIGPVVVSDIEKKGKQNRRVRIKLG
jgi:misacylated tRNA(Ala) deacylase